MNCRVGHCLPLQRLDTPMPRAYLGAMKEAPDNHELDKRLIRLEGRMETMRSDLQATLERLRADMANWKTDMANWKTDMANREIRLIFAMIAIVGIGLTVFGFLTAS